MFLVSIVGAGRSGTNLLAETFDHESRRFRNLYENRYIWSYGQRDLRCDNRDATDATPKVRNYIRRHFERQLRAPDDFLIDKTPSNALRIPFLAAVIPEIKIISIIRDGRDNIVSRARQWDGQRKGEDPNVRTAGSMSGKARILADRVNHLRRLYARGNLPLDRIPAMLADNVPALALHLTTGRPRRYAERVAGLPHVLSALGLDAAAAVQWRETVMAAHIDGNRLGPERFLEVRYEALVADPRGAWSRIMRFVGLPESGGGARHLESTVRPQGADWRHASQRQRIRSVEAYLRPTLEYLGYAWDEDARALTSNRFVEEVPQEAVR